MYRNVGSKAELLSHVSHSVAVGNERKYAAGILRRSQDQLEGPFDLCQREHYRSFEKGDHVDLEVALRKVRYKQGLPVDASGVTQDGKAFANIHEFRKYLVEQDEQLARNLAQRFLTFAPGSGVSFANRSTAESILRETKDDGYPGSLASSACRP